jgi:fatty-acyl-CoA synthase
MSADEHKGMVPLLLDLPSYCHGASDVPLIGDTIGTCLDRVANAHSDAEALVSCAEGLRYTYGQLRMEVDRLARGLIALRVRRGDRIGIWSGNCAQWVITQYAVAKIGGILVGINPALQRAELDYALRQVGVSVLLAARRHLARDGVAMVDELVRPLTSTTGSDQSGSLKHIVLLGSGTTPGWATTWAELLEQGEGVSSATLADQQAACQCDDPALILFTSGTTGIAKAATLTHHSIVNNGFFIGERLEYTPAARLCVPMPLYHSIGCVAGTIAAMTHGSTLVLPGFTFEPQSCLAAVDSERCTSLYGVPSMFVAQYQHPALAKYKVDSLRTGIIAGASCSSEIMMQVIDRMHLPEVTTCYGLTETRCLFQSQRNDSMERRVSTVGRIQPHVECKIIDPKTGQTVPRGSSGELCARGYGTMLGYWNNDDATRHAIDAARWFHTGDLATLSQDGYLTIVGRIKDTIIRGGENVSPTEVEAVLRSCEKVVDACVVGVPDIDYGEELCAWIRVKESETATGQEIRRFCRQRLARHKVPRHVMFIERFPLTVTGKVQKYRLREMATAALAERREALT